MTEQRGHLLEIVMLLQNLHRDTHDGAARFGEELMHGARYVERRGEGRR